MPKKVYYEPSRTLMEFRLLPGLTTEESAIYNISLRTPLVYSSDENSKYFLNIPIVSAAMQSVSGVRMGIELARLGGVAFIYCSQSVGQQADMIRQIKKHKAGFVPPETVSPDMPIRQLYELTRKRGYNTFPVVDEKGRLLGIITKNDYDVKPHGDLQVQERMVPRSELTVGVNIENIKEANTLLRETHQSVLPIVDDDDKLLYLVFRKDIRNHLDNPYEVLDEHKRLLTTAAINTHDYEQRVPALVEAGADVLAIDSSDGHSVFQARTLQWIHKNYPDVPVIGGNIITEEGFDYLVEHGARAVKVGMGGGSICITQEQKGTGRGLATSIIKVAEARDRYYQRSGRYIPIVADGGIVSSKDVVVALALGADYVMMGRFFARMDESPTEKVTIKNQVMKPYWGEGSARAREWKEARYNQMLFVEGVEGFVQYAGKLRDNLPEALAKIKASMSSVGAANIKELHEKAELEVVSALSIREGQPHDIYLPGSESNYNAIQWGS
ncbi:MAG TPA: IMP dehydrogenase [Caldithrix abyssi]|uniref:IMP dehydrogenase n=1 Tax=Caldithrix abyssi TaxID=187145 RepID=A0A7V4TZF9_CALAY|nr:IMP dehydrogenase [Caldithrix abyssi]